MWAWQPFGHVTRISWTNFQGWCYETSLSPTKIFLLTVPRQYFFSESSLLFVFVFALLPAAVGKGLTSWLSCMWCFLVLLSLSHMVSWVRCCTWLYQFLIFAFLTLHSPRHLKESPYENGVQNSMTLFQSTCLKVLTDRWWTDRRPLKSLAGGKNISILHLSCRTIDLQF